MSFYKGELKILYVKRLGVYVPVACLTSNDFTEDSEVISTTTRESLGWESVIIGRQSASISFSAFYVNKATDFAPYSFLRGVARARTLVEWKIEDATTTDEGTGYFTNLEVNASADGLVEFSGSLQIVDEPTYTFVTPVGDYQFQDGDDFLFQDGSAFSFN